MSRSSTIQQAIDNTQAYIDTVHYNRFGFKKWSGGRVKRESWARILVANNVVEFQDRLNTEMDTFAGKGRYADFLTALQICIVKNPAELDSWFVSRVRSMLSASDRDLVAAFPEESKTYDEVADDDGVVYPVGNEPFIQVPVECQQTEDFVLVGTSALQALKIGLGLAKPNAAGAYPNAQIVILDISKNVTRFWQYVKQAFEDASSIEQACAVLQDNRATLIAECMGGKSDLFDGKSGRREGVLGFLCALESAHGFDRLKQTIIRADVRLQDWTKKPQAPIIEPAGRPVIVYASNIVAYVDQSTTGFAAGMLMNPERVAPGYSKAREDIMQTLVNIASLRPEYTLHTNMNHRELRPTCAMWFEGAGPQSCGELKHTLFSPKVMNLRDHSTLRYERTGDVLHVVSTVAAALAGEGRGSGQGCCMTSCIAAGLGASLTR